MNKDIVFFFNGKFNNWLCTNVTYVEHGVRGFVKDGQWWMDYNPSTETVFVCIASLGSVDWDKPINVMTHMGKPTIITVEDHVTGTYNEIMDWARNERSTQMA